MRKAKNSNSSETYPKMRPALTPEADQSQMISLAYNLVRQRLLDGTASSQETTHFLKLGTEKAKLENKLLEAQTEMAIAKKEALESEKRSAERFEEALKAFRTYSGQGSAEEMDDLDDEY